MSLCSKFTVGDRRAGLLITMGGTVVEASTLTYRSNDMDIEDCLIFLLKSVFVSGECQVSRFVLFI